MVIKSPYEISISDIAVNDAVGSFEIKAFEKDGGQGSFRFAKFPKEFALSWFKINNQEHEPIYLEAGDKAHLSWNANLIDNSSLELFAYTTQAQKPIRLGIVHQPTQRGDVLKVACADFPYTITGDTQFSLEGTYNDSTGTAVTVRLDNTVFVKALKILSFTVNGVKEGTLNAFVDEGITISWSTQSAVRVEVQRDAEIIKAFDSATGVVNGGSFLDEDNLKENNNYVYQAVVYGASGDKQYSVALNVCAFKQVITINVFDFPEVVIITPSGQYAYVGNMRPDCVSIIEIARHTKLQDILLVSPSSIAITPDSQYAYVANGYPESVSVIDIATHTKLQDISVGHNISNEPKKIAITPDGQYAYVTNSGSDSVSVIDVAKRTKLQSDIRFGDIPSAIAITADSQYAYVTNYGSNSVSVIDVAKRTKLQDIAVGKNPEAIAITADSQYAYVTNYGSNSVSVIDVAKRTKLQDIAVGKNPQAIAITPDSRYAYVANYDSGSVSVIDVTKRTNLRDIAVGKNPEAIAITPDGRYAYVTNYGSNSVSMIEIAEQIRLKDINVGEHPYKIAITPDGQYAYVTNRNSSSVSVIKVEGAKKFKILATDHSDSVSIIRIASVEPRPVSLTSIKPVIIKFAVNEIEARAVKVFLGEINIVWKTENATRVELRRNGKTINNFAGSSGLAPSGNFRDDNDNNELQKKNVYQNVYQIAVYGGSPEVEIVSESINAEVFRRAMPILGMKSPTHVAISPNGKYAYVTDQGSDCVWVIEIATRIKTEITVGDSPIHIAITPNGEYAYVASSVSKRLSRINVSNNKTDKDKTDKYDSALLKFMPKYIAITPDSQYAYALGPNSCEIQAVHFKKTNEPPSIRNIVLKNSASHIAITPNGNYGVVSCGSAAHVSIIDVKQHQIIKDAISVKSNPQYVAISVDSRYAYVAHPHLSNQQGKVLSNQKGKVSNTISVIDIDTRIKTEITVGDSPTHIAITPNGKYAYVANNKSNNVSIIEIPEHDNDKVKEITVGDSPTHIAITPNGKYACVANEASKDVSIIQIRNHANLGKIKFNKSPTHIAITPDSQYAFVVKSGSESISLIKIKREKPKQDVKLLQEIDNPSSSFLYGVMPNKKMKVMFQEKIVVGDGDCGFHALKTDRTSLVNAIKGFKKATEKRNYLSPEIQDAFSSEHVETLPEKWQELRNKSNSQQAEVDDLVRNIRSKISQNLDGLDTHGIIEWLKENNYKDYAESLNKENDILTKAEGETQQYYCKEEAFEYYLERLNSNWWLGYKSALLYAEAEKFNLCIWKKEENSNEVSLVESYFTENPKESIHILHTAGFTHFNSLVEVRGKNKIIQEPIRQKNINQLEIKKSSSETNLLFEFTKQKQGLNIREIFPENDKLIENPPNKRHDPNTPEFNHFNSLEKEVEENKINQEPIRQKNINQLKMKKSSSETNLLFKFNEKKEDLNIRQVFPENNKLRENPPNKRRERKKWVLPTLSGAGQNA